MGLLRNLFLISVPAVVVILLLLEGILRIVGYVPWYLDGRAYIPSTNPGTVYELRPGFSGLYAGVPVTINSEGFRGKELARQQPHFRLVVVGDSFAFSQGVRDNETLAEQLAVRLQQKIGSSVDVINLGVPGYNTCQEYWRFKERVLPLKPQAALLLYVENDTEPPPFSVKGDVVISPDVRTGLWGSFAAAARESSAAYNLAWTRFQLLKGATYSIDQYRGLIAKKFDSTNPLWMKSKACLADMIALAKTQSIRLVVIPFPILQGLTTKPYPFEMYTKAVCDAARAGGAECLDIVPALQNLEIQLTVSQTERHPSAEVYRRITEPIVAILP